MSTLCLIIALILFLFAAFDRPKIPRIAYVGWLGMAALALSFLLPL